MANTKIRKEQLESTVVGTTDTQTLTNKTIDGDNNILSNLGIGNEVDWASATDVANRSATPATGDKLLLFENGVGLRKIDWDDLPSGGTSVSFGTDNQVPYTNSGGTDFDYSANLTFDGADLAVNTDNLFVDGSTGNVGIGTTTPNNKIQVAGLIEFNSIQANTILGENSGNSLGSSSEENTAIGHEALYTAISAGRNTAIGRRALYSNTSGQSNAGIGRNALYFNTTGFGNLALGTNAMQNNVSGSTNTAIGADSLFDNNSGEQNVAVGSEALSRNNGSRNTAIGVSVASRVTSGIRNTVMGYGSFANADTGNNNTVLGFFTGQGITSGDSNTIIGSNVTGLSATLSNNIILADGSGNRRINVDSSGNVGIGTTAPDTKLHVAGAVTQEPLSADPADPDAGNSVQWVSDGTGSGDVGDVMMKINVGGTVKTVTLIDFSQA